MTLPSEYIEILRAKGRPLDDVGSDETALRKPDALAAVACLCGTPIPILGGDVWKVADGRLRTRDNWYAEQRADESQEEYVHRSHCESRDYISRYPEAGPQEVFYVLVTPR